MVLVSSRARSNDTNQSIDWDEEKLQDLCHEYNANTNIDLIIPSESEFPDTTISKNSVLEVNRRTIDNRTMDSPENRPSRVRARPRKQLLSPSAAKAAPKNADLKLKERLTEKQQAKNSKNKSKVDHSRNDNESKESRLSAAEGVFGEPNGTHDNGVGYLRNIFLLCLFC